MGSITDRIYDLAQELGRFPVFIGTSQISAGVGAPGAGPPKSALYIRLDGGADTTLYVREAAGAVVDATASLDGITIAADDTVTIGGVVYTFVASLAAAYDVLVGALDTDSLDNLIAAINGDAGEGSTYGTGTVAHPSVTALAGTGDTMDITAIAAGSAGNGIATTAVLTSGDWDNPSTLGGTDDDGTGWAAK
jgi:hypothetical protein